MAHLFRIILVGFETFLRQAFFVLFKKAKLFQVIQTLNFPILVVLITTILSMTIFLSFPNVAIAETNTALNPNSQAIKEIAPPPQIMPQLPMPEIKPEISQGPNLGFSIQNTPNIPSNLVGCTWNSCNFQDPIAMKCDIGAVTLKTTSLYFLSYLYGVVEARFSPNCAAKWARATLYNGNFRGNDLTAYLYADNWTGWFYTKRNQKFATSMYSTMYSSQYSFRACGDVDPPDSSPSCTQPF